MTDRPIPDETMREAWAAYDAVSEAEPMTRKCVEIIARALFEAEKRGMRRGYLAGFNASSEGYNGEYPFDDRDDNPADDPDWIASRDRILAEIGES